MLGLGISLCIRKPGAGVPRPANTAVPTIAGALQVGQVWTVTPGTWTLSPSLTYQWYRDTTPISAETTTTCTLATADIGHTIKCRESDSANGTHADSVASATVLSNDTSLSVLTVATALLTATAWTDGATKECEASAISATIVATPTNGSARVTYTDSVAGYEPSGSVALAAGANTITVVVTAADGLTTATSILTLNATGVVPTGPLAPTIDYTAPTVGDTLSCSPVDTGTGATSFNYAWSNGSAIGSNASTYTAQRSDAGLAITCTVTPANAFGTGTPVDTSATALVTAAPLCTVNPVCTTNGSGGGTVPGGPCAVNDTLSTTDGTWTGYPAPAFSYSNNGTAGDVNSSVTLLSGDLGRTICFTVTASNDIGSSGAASNGIAVSLYPPAGTVAPTLNNNTPTAGNTITCAPHYTGSDSPSFNYAWSNGSAIGSNASTYTAQVSDAGLSITCTVTSVNAYGSGTPGTTSATSLVTAVPVCSAAPVCTTDGAGGGAAPGGPCFAGDTLSTTDGTWTGYPAPTLSYTNTGASGGTGNTVAVMGGDYPGTIHFTVTASNSLGSSGASSNGMTVGIPPPAGTVAPTLNNIMPAAGDTITCTPNYTGSDSPSFNYAWSNGSAIGSNASTYTAQGSDAGLAITCTVTPTNAFGSGTPAATSATSLVTAPPFCAAGPVCTTNGAGGGTVPGGPCAVGDTLSTTNGTWTGYPAPTFSYSNNGAAGGATSSVTLLSGDLGGTICFTVTASNSFGSSVASSNGIALSLYPPAGTIAPTLNNTTPTAGDTITCAPNYTAGDSPSFNYAWSNGSAIGSNASTCTAQRSDMGLAITCTVTPTNAFGGGTPVATAATSLVTAVPLCTVAPVITCDGASAPNGPADHNIPDTMYVDGTNGSTAAVFTGYPAPTLSYAWYDVLKNFAFGTSSTFPTAINPSNSPAVCVVTADNGIGSPIPALSNTINVV